MSEKEFLTGLARAFGGAIIFALPILMTMEVWWLGFYMDRLRLVLFMVLMFPLLVGLSHFAGFRPTTRWRDDVADAAVAYGVAFVASAIVLVLFDVINTEMPFRDVLGKVSLQAVGASFGAVIATAQLGAPGDEPQNEQAKEPGYWGEVLLMVGGAVFLAYNVAPTEEMILIAFKMTMWHGVALALVSLLLMHAFVYAVNFRGQASVPEGTPLWSIFLRFTVVGYAVALLVSAYVLWTFGRYEDHAFALYVMMAVVLGFPASIGAAAARLVL